MSTENNDANLAVLAQKVDAIHANITDMQVAMRDLTNAIDALDAGSPREAVETLRWTAQELVRPLSHDLATQRESFTPVVPPGTALGLDWSGVLRDATTGHPIPPVTFADTAVTFPESPVTLGRNTQ